MHKIYKMSDNSKSVIEAVIKDENINLMHMVLMKNESLKTHYSNANIYMLVKEGLLSLKLNEGVFETFEKNTIINIPFNTKMYVQNNDNEMLEILVFKAPAPNNEIYK